MFPACHIGTNPQFQVSLLFSLFRVHSNYFVSVTLVMTMLEIFLLTLPPLITQMATELKLHY